MSPAFVHRFIGFSHRVMGFWVGCSYSCALSRLHEPDVQHLKDFFDDLISRLDVLVQNLVQIFEFFPERWTPDRPVDAWLVDLIERHLRGHVEIVFDPEAGPAIRDTPCLRISPASCPRNSHRTSRIYGRLSSQRSRRFSSMRR